MKKYWQLIQQFGPELTILTETPLDVLSSGDSPRLAEAVRRVRQNLVHKKAGFDGVFGSIKVGL